MTFRDTLLAEHGHTRHRDMLKPYEIFIGSWEFDWIGHEADGSTWTVPGEWHFAWILEGRAIQDNWICPRRDLRSSGQFPEGEYGTTLRFYDFRDNCLKVVWFGPILSQLSLFRAEVELDRIVQTELNRGATGKFSRWIFRDITKQSFTWEAYVSEDDALWTMNQEVRARRMGTV